MRASRRVRRPQPCKNDLRVRIAHQQVRNQSFQAARAPHGNDIRDVGLPARQQKIDVPAQPLLPSGQAVNAKNLQNGRPNPVRSAPLKGLLRRVVHRMLGGA